jgi:glycosyltransferase involved in cell wall biosynthesis
MACGIPVVATRSGGPEEIIRDGETGLLVDVEQPDQMADAILRLLQDAALRARISAAARQDVVSRFCGQEARNVTRLYQTLVGR